MSSIEEFFKGHIPVSLFDENYFLYFETFDFTHNLAKQGKKIYVVKNIFVMGVS